MTKEQVEKALIEMERLREASRLADDVDEQRQLPTTITACGARCARTWKARSPTPRANEPPA